MTIQYIGIMIATIFCEKEAGLLLHLVFPSLQVFSQQRLELVTLGKDKAGVNKICSALTGS